MKIKIEFRPTGQGQIPDRNKDTRGSYDWQKYSNL